MLESNLSADLGAAETDVGRAFARLSSCFAPPWDRHLSEKLVMLVRRSVQALLPTRKPVDPDYLLSSVSFSLCCLPRSKLENMRRHNCEHCGRRAHAPMRFYVRARIVGADGRGRSNWTHLRMPRVTR